MKSVQSTSNPRNTLDPDNAHKIKTTVLQSGKISFQMENKECPRYVVLELIRDS